MMGRTTEQIADVPRASAVTVVAGDQLLLKSGTLATLENAHNITGKMYSASPGVKVAVKDGKDLPKLVDGLMELLEQEMKDLRGEDAHQVSGEGLRVLSAGCPGVQHINVASYQQVGNGLQDLRGEDAQQVSVEGLRALSAGFQGE